MRRSDRRSHGDQLPNGFMKLRISTRLVILTRRKVYKIPVDLRGWLQGINEAKAWNRYKHTGTLAPLLWSLGGLVCMERVQPLGYVSRSSVAYVKSLVPALDVKNCDLHNVENWGYHCGRVVLLDYGLDERVSKMY